MRMFLNVIQTVIYIFSVQVVAFVDFGHGQVALEMIEQGKNQYQLLEERGRLPKYGECWQSAVEHIHEGCRYLSEDTQSDIALHITNCFLQMSGHETYKCELDKKPNLRGICINSMSDRAFNVYTEFYTHTQNICWFLRGQIWQEKITENSMKVGKRLETSMSQQELLLKRQELSIDMQEKLLQYGLSLERVLNESRIQASEVIEEIRISTLKHQHLLTVMGDSFGGLKSWLIGEISWFDSLIFYIGSGLIILVLTTTPRTSSARLPLLLTLSFNMVLERTICNKLSPDLSGIRLTHEILQTYIWWCRRICVFACTSILLVLMYMYRDYTVINNRLLLRIEEQNRMIREALDRERRSESVDMERSDWNGVHSTTISPRNTYKRFCSPQIQDSPESRTYPDVHRTYNLRSRLTPNKYTKSNGIS